MRQVFYTILILMGAIAFVGCKDSSEPANDVPMTEPNVIEPNIAEPNETLSSERPTTPESDTFEIQGTVVHKSIEGGFFAIDGDDGRKYNPIILPESYRKDGLRVIITARLRIGAMSIHMYGAIIEVVEIAAK